MTAYGSEYESEFIKDGNWICNGQDVHGKNNEPLDMYGNPFGEERPVYDKELLLKDFNNYLTS